MHLRTGPAIAAIVASCASAQPVIDTIGTPSGASGVASTFVSAVNFSFASAFSGVAIEASLVSVGASTGTAYLTTQVGPGTDASHVIEQVVFDFTVVGDVNADLGYVALFSDLDLGPGSYWLVLGGPDTGGGGLISQSASATYATHADASVGGTYFSFSAAIAPFHPASTFSQSGGNAFIKVTGPAIDCPADLSPPPEGDGSVDTNDFFQFLAYYQAQDPAADFSPGGGVNTNDFFAFLAAYQAGCP